MEAQTIFLQNILEEGVTDINLIRTLANKLSPYGKLLFLEQYYDIAERVLDLKNETFFPHVPMESDIAKQYLDIYFFKDIDFSNIFVALFDQNCSKYVLDDTKKILLHLNDDQIAIFKRMFDHSDHSTIYDDCDDDDIDNENIDITDDKRKILSQLKIYRNEINDDDNKITMLDVEKFFRLRRKNKKNKYYQKKDTNIYDKYYPEENEITHDSYNNIDDYIQEGIGKDDELDYDYINELMTSAEPYLLDPRTGYIHITLIGGRYIQLFTILKDLTEDQLNKWDQKIFNHFIFITGFHNADDWTNNSSRNIFSEIDGLYKSHNNYGIFHWSQININIFNKVISNFIINYPELAEVVNVILNPNLINNFLNIYYLNFGSNIRYIT